MSWLDKSCLQLLIRRKDKTETLTFQVRMVLEFHLILSKQMGKTFGQHLKN